MDEPFVPKLDGKEWRKIQRSGLGPVTSSPCFITIGKGSILPGAFIPRPAGQASQWPPWDLQKEKGYIAQKRAIRTMGRREKESSITHTQLKGLDALFFWRKDPFWPRLLIEWQHQCIAQCILVNREDKRCRFRCGLNSVNVLCDWCS